MENSYDKEIKELSERAYNVLERLGGVQRMIDFYLSGRSFMDLPMSGKKTVEELNALCAQLLKTEQKSKEKKAIAPTSLRNRLRDVFIIDNIAEAILQYYSAKKLISSNAQQYLNVLEKDFMISVSYDQRELFLITHFNPVFRFVRKMGLTPTDFIALNLLQSKMAVFIGFNNSDK